MRPPVAVTAAAPYNGSRTGATVMAMVKLIEPQNMGELALIKSLLDGNGIAYFVQNEHLGSLLPGVPFVASVVMVEDWDLDRAGTLLGRLGPPPCVDEAG